MALRLVIAGVTREAWAGTLRSLAVAVEERDWRRLVRFPVQGPVDLFLFVGGSVVSALQTRLGVEVAGRALGDDEKQLAAAALTPALDLDAVRIKEGSCGLLGLPGRAFVLGETVFLPSSWLRRAPARDYRPTLVHELVHVWQFRTRGLRYLSESLWAQWFGEGYDFRPALARGRGFRDLNPEQQARLVEEWFRNGS